MVAEMKKATSGVACSSLFTSTIPDFGRFVKKQAAYSRATGCFTA
jgi:hypothetical protein